MWAHFKQVSHCPMTGWTTTASLSALVAALSLLIVIVCKAWFVSNGFGSCCTLLLLMAPILESWGEGENFLLSLLFSLPQLSQCLGPVFHWWNPPMLLWSPVFLQPNPSIRGNPKLFFLMGYLSHLWKKIAVFQLWFYEIVAMKNSFE